MKKKIMASLLALCALSVVNPVSASADWHQDNTGWWYNVGNDYYSNGWAYIDGEWYYFNSAGYMVTGWIQDGGKWYYLNSSGAMAKNTTVEGYVLGSDGAWIQGASNNNSYEADSSKYIASEKIKMDVERGSDAYNKDTKTLTVKVVNNEKNSISYDSFYEVEKLINGSWVKLEDSKNNTNSYANKEIKSKESSYRTYILAALKDFNNLTSGTYRIAQGFNCQGEKKIAYAEFKLKDQTFASEVKDSKNNVVLVPENSSRVYDLGTKCISVYAVNNSDKDCFYGEYFDVYKLENGKWTLLNFNENAAFNDIAVGLDGKGTVNHEMFYISMLKDFDTLKAGKYKLVTSIPVNDAGANGELEFELK